jgi:hypothetical protein
VPTGTSANTPVNIPPRNKSMPPPIDCVSSRAIGRSMMACSAKRTTATEAATRAFAGHISKQTLRPNIPTAPRPTK